MKLLLTTCAAALMLLSLVAGPASAVLVDFMFTGTGVNGSTASGSFSVDGGSITPGYFASGGIYPSLSLTISNIPGDGPATVSFDRDEIAATLFSVGPDGTAFIGPSGSHNFGPPEENHYDLGPTQPFLPALTYVSDLGYNLRARDVITWSAAIPVSVPEPSSAALALAGLVAGLIAIRGSGRRSQLAPKEE